MPKPRIKYPKALAKIRAFLAQHSQREAEKKTEVDQATWSKLSRQLINPNDITRERLRKIGVRKGDWL
jgi:hypothetical protein